MSDTKHTPGYRVTADGRVFSTAHNWRGYGEREMQQAPNGCGYLSVRLTINGKRVRLAVHRLVAQTFLPPRPSKRHEVRHLDGNKLNNDSKNLAWGTSKENADDRERHGRTSRGTAHSAFIKSSEHAMHVKRGAEHYETKRRASHV